MFIYGHLLIAVGLTATGVGIKKVIQYADESYLPAGGYWALCGGAALFLTGVSLIYVVSTRFVRGRVLVARAAAAYAALLLAVIGPLVPLFLLVNLLLLTLLVLVTFEVIEKPSATPSE